MALKVYLFMSWATYNEFIELCSTDESLTDITILADNTFATKWGVRLIWNSVEGMESGMNILHIYLSSLNYRTGTGQTSVIDYYYKYISYCGNKLMSLETNDLYGKFTSHISTEITVMDNDTDFIDDFDISESISALFS